MLIQRQNISFKGFKINPEAKPYIKNSLPGAIGYEENFTSIDVSKVLVAFKKRMQKLAKSLEKKKGLDIVLEKQQDIPVLSFRNLQGDKVLQSLPLTELHPQPKGNSIKILTMDDSRQNFDSILAKTHKWIETNFPNTSKKPAEIKESELYKTDKNWVFKKIITGSAPKKAPKTLTEAVDRVFV